MVKYISVFFTLVITSLYLFPFELTAVKEVNSKMVLAVLGCVILLFQSARKRSMTVNRNFLMLVIFASIVSLIGVFSVVYNNTPDYAYATYLISMLVWVGAAYTVCSTIRLTYGDCTLRLLCHYLIAVCVIQCLLAIYIDLSLPFKHLVDTYIEQDQLFLNAKQVKRLYGIGASLDVAGSRFAAVLVMIMYLMTKPRESKRWYHYVLYVLAFIIIGVIGNMISRTTLIGIAIAFGYLMWTTFIHLRNLKANNLRAWRWLIVVLIVCLPVIVYSYQTNSRIHKNIRFGFEGFFSLAEKGRWEVSSNDRLKNMYVYPQALKTWLIGDGYFANPKSTDPNYIGTNSEGFYMSTDVGYLRFIFYFGVIGLMGISFFIIKSGDYCIGIFPDYKLLFLMLLAVNFIVWFKVSTDIFLVFALILCASQKTMGGDKELPYERS
jgi:hypothetical protein